MDIKIKSITDFGTRESEKVTFEVVGNCDLDDYMIADTTYTGETTISNKIRHTYWFPAQAVIAGDETVLYTKNGKNTTEDLGKGKGTRYIYFWNLGISVWNNTGDGANLFKIASRKATKVL